jgi:glycosyltransferase involved in cell wall biosynthesis
VNPRVSVLLPYRDAGATIEEALGSVLEERGIAFEVIAVDDGSRDDGPEVVRRMAARDGRIAAIASGGRGIVGALGVAADAARGALLARMDGDDVSIPGRLAAEAALLEGDPRLGVVGTQVEVFGEGVGEGMRRYVAWMNGLETPEDHARDLFVESPLCHPSVMIRREALEDAGGYREVAWAEDYDLWLRMHARGWKIAKVPSILLRWRRHAGQVTWSDPRCGLARFDQAKGLYLAPELRRMGRTVAVWGAGKTGKRIGRAIGEHGIVVELYVDIDPRKIGGVARGAPIVAPADLPRGKYSVVVAVGARGAREIVRGRLTAAGFVEGVDYVCAS